MLSGQTEKIGGAVKSIFRILRVQLNGELRELKRGYFFRVCLHRFFVPAVFGENFCEGERLYAHVRQRPQ